MRSHLRLLFLCGLALGCAGKSAAGTGSPTPTATGTPGACPTGGITSSTVAIDLSADCHVVGNITLSGTASLTMTGATLSVDGSIVLSGQAKVTVSGGGLTFPQTSYGEYSITLNDTSGLTLQNSTFITNGTTGNNFSMALDAHNSSTVDFESSTLSTEGSWLLANFHDQSQLTVSHSTNLPTEAYPLDSSKTSITNSAFAGIWLDFLAGTTATVTVPKQNAQGIFDFSFGNSPGLPWSVDMQSTAGRLGLNTYPGSNLTVNGGGLAGLESDAGLVFGYYLQDNTAPVTLNGLNVGSNMTLQMTDSGRNLQLNNVNLNPFSWQVYVSESNGFPVTVSNSKINEIAALTNGLITISDDVLQLAITGAVGPGSQVTITGTQIWSQAIEATDGGQMTISGSQLHGNFIFAEGPGSTITLSSDPDLKDAAAGTSCAPVGNYPPNDDGVPLCNPFNPIGQCSQVVTVDGGVVTGAPSCS